MSLTPSNYNIIPLIKRESIVSILEKGNRTDGRKFTDYRSLSITQGYAKKAEGSAMVRLGDTAVLAGVKVKEDVPFPDTPDQGNFIVNVELLPLAYETFEPGPPDENAVELSRVVDRGLRDSKAVDLKGLCLVPGKKVWTVWIDIDVLDYGGNVLDASMLAAVAALYDARLPKVEVNGDEVKVVKDEKGNRVPMNYPVVSVSVAKLDRFLLVDPDLEEESMAEARLSISYLEDGKIVGMQKFGNGTLSVQELDTVEGLARTSSQRLFEELKKVIASPEGGVSQ
ncbi:exosome complex exonuclease [Sulfodiicoccus acidiphilus]|uniref:Exosome complex component Rrp42 n=1 Tax=Sulfodiicoccus acidiphilus TaxID=1670455 RepID=A0A348B129_9CREN|nr:exosome complex protein Rrp42 [Sulfodiicoccus acidiphilus]BBD71881.1 exosome complex exonuclease [Sulfodiicoccus acidiphilus]GGT91175.1 exosome complex exonuclease [Sulfodiicoccus acidiphilus]